MITTVLNTFENNHDEEDMGESLLPNKKQKMAIISITRQKVVCGTEIHPLVYQ
jgi:hypothetical protein